MNANDAVLTYTLLMVPSMFALSVTIQGIQRTILQKKDGIMVLIFGLIFFALILATYFFFIR